jgi:hypothetical protein
MHFLALSPQAKATRPEVSVLHLKADIATEIVEAGYGPLKADIATEIVEAGYGPCSYEGSVSLAAQERRDIENGLLDRIAHNGEAAVRIEVPRSMARIFRESRVCRQPFGVADRGADADAVVQRHTTGLAVLLVQGNHARDMQNTSQPAVIRKLGFFPRRCPALIKS